MLKVILIQIGLLHLIYFVFDLKVLLCYSGASFLGIIFFETVTYLEHYGLRRLKTGTGSYERVKPIHSWNSNHILGRSILFEVTRHSDHHFLASRKYQVLRHFDDAPQPPAGYLVMILCTLFPPFWFNIMRKHLEKIKQERIAINQPITSIT
ncbi:MAG: alkane 1-monooxygenase [Parvicellaceae bacterium]|jgi:alkane 1-monooxygenase